MSKYSYGFIKVIRNKSAVSRLADILLHSKDVYTVELDFKKCSDNIPLDYCKVHQRAVGNCKIYFNQASRR